MSEVETSVEEKVDLDSLISGAIEKAEATEAEPAPETTASSERSRDDKGRFAKESEPKPSDRASGSDGTAQAPVAAVEPALEAPRNYTAEQKAIFATLDRKAQEHWVAFEKQREAEFTRKSQAEAEYRRTADPLLNALVPFKEYLTQVGPQVGRQPHEMISDLLAVEYRLRNGDVQTKVQALGQIAASYGIDLSALARGEIREPDASITQQHQHFQALQQRLDHMEQVRQQEETARLTQHIADFTNSKDENGNPKYPFFERVREPMGRLLEHGLASTLEEAYRKATAMDEDLHKEAQAAQQKAAQEAEEKRKAEALAKAEKVKPVKATGTQPHGKTTGKGLDNIIREAMASHGM